MATDIITIIMDSVSATFTGLGTSVLALWTTLIYDTTTGLTNIATMGLVFMGLSFGISIFFLILKKFF